MVHPLIGIHAALGEIGIFAFLWVFVEILNPTDQRMKRAKIVATLGFIFLLLSWIAGGYYYLNYYGPQVKPIIKEGPAPWAHEVVMEAKEHIFLFLPFLALLAAALLHQNAKSANQTRRATLLLCAIIILTGLAMAAMGYLISSGARAALEVA
ncbi:hypothetical protein J4457_06780 [Candidatus Woesearchaeota archaeon]|nr:hypothetical protein [Candidatus Woesearchaeota archaeon]